MPGGQQGSRGQNGAARVPRGGVKRHGVLVRQLAAKRGAWANFDDESSGKGRQCGRNLGSDALKLNTFFPQRTRDRGTRKIASDPWFGVPPQAAGRGLARRGRSLPAVLSNQRLTG